MAKALTLLAIGDLTGGFATYEARFAPTQKDALTFLTRATRWTPETRDAPRSFRATRMPAS